VPPTTPESTLPAQVSPPEFALSDTPLDSVRGADVVALPLLPGADAPLLASGDEEVAGSMGLDLLAVAAHQRATGAAGEVTSVVAFRDGDPVTVLLVGVGRQRPVDYRRAGAATARAAQDREALATSITAGAPDGAVEAFVVGAMLGSFGFHWRSDGPAHHPVHRVALAGVTGEDAADELHRAIALGGAGWLARQLAWVPSNLKNPGWLAEQAETIAAESGLACTVWDEDQLTREGMGGILAVGRASATPPRLVRLDYTPAKAGRRTPHVVLVGKGITFDSGGLSIKPAESMTTMKRDMTGGAVVMAALGALAGMRCPVRVTGLVPAAENAVGGDALRPGDVVRQYGGRTTEVTNTDAEGRVVMADAIAYAAAELQPDAIVDVATLTGAVKAALGQGIGGLFAADDALATALRSAGEEAGEPFWRMPLVADYRDRLSSKVADADNAPGGAGAIMAALFLQAFAGDVPWAHLDIASVGDSPREHFEWSEGPTGYGVRALLQWLARPEPLAGVGD
jgi:leucyl aminopeptidase